MGRFYGKTAVLIRKLKNEEKGRFPSYDKKSQGESPFSIALYGSLTELQ